MDFADVALICQRPLRLLWAWQPDLRLAACQIQIDSLKIKLPAGFGRAETRRVKSSRAKATSRLPGPQQS